MSEEQNKEVKEENIKKDKDEWSELAKTLVLALLLALVIRTLFYEPFNIPSGSMKPNLLVGDYLFVSKPSYGYSQYSFPFGMAEYEGRIMETTPDRGDIIVFRKPSDTSIDYIKRLIGMPGDKIMLIGGRLYINGERAERELVGYKQVESHGSTTRMAEYIETLPNGKMYKIYEEDDIHIYDNVPEVTVPEGHYFFMGDNRDNSQDSRFTKEVGFVPFDNLIGRAEFIFFSTNGEAKIFEFWKWPFSIRYNRILDKISSAQIAKEEAINE